MIDKFSYSGTELELVANAHNWKKYLCDSIKPYLGSSILDVGAGIGSTAKMLTHRTFDRYVAVEPDEQLYIENYKRTKHLENKYPYTLLHGLSSDPRIDGYFDTILYVDVLEHIEHDKDELSFIKNKLLPHGRIIIISPAHNFLFSNFDAQIGHFRRYNKAMFKQIIPTGMQIKNMVYIDSIGLLASCTNKYILKCSTISAGQVKFWDTIIVRLSTVFDKLFQNTIGKTIICILENEETLTFK